MSNFSSTLRTAAAWLLLGVLSGVAPALAASQPGTLATLPTLTAPSLAIPRYELARIAALPRSGRQDTQTTTGASAPPPDRHHLSPWVWVAIVAGAGVGIGAGVLSGNSQSGKTVPVTPTAIVNVGSGGVTAGPPH